VTPSQALAFVERHGVVLLSARGPVPSLAEAIAGGPIRGSWWGHPKGQEIFRVSEAVCDSGDILVCKLVGGKVTYVHRRLWPALVALSGRFRKEQLARVWNEHTARGAHRTRRQPFPAWVPKDALEAAKRLSVPEAEELLGALIAVVSGARRARAGAGHGRREGDPRPSTGARARGRRRAGWRPRSPPSRFPA
jgi:hypothetical protein